MRIGPLIAFYGRRHEQIEAIVRAHAGTGTPIILDLAWSLAPFLKRHFPQLNDQGILDDALVTLQAMFDDSPPVNLG